MWVPGFLIRRRGRNLREGEAAAVRILPNKNRGLGGGGPLKEVLTLREELAEEDFPRGSLSSENPMARRETVKG